MKPLQTSYAALDRVSTSVDTLRRSLKNVIDERLLTKDAKRQKSIMYKN